MWIEIVQVHYIQWINQANAWVVPKDLECRLLHSRAWMNRIDNRYILKLISNSLYSPENVAVWLSL
ncbi:hypothetical protein D1872_274300 [compost metagenome]